MKIIKTGTSRIDAKRRWEVMVDDEDYEYLNQFSWNVDPYGCVKSRLGSNKNKSILIHRFIMDCPPELEVDHIDGNRLNNQRSNLRLATSSQNKMNRGPRKDCKSGYKGVSWHRQRSKWTSRIKIDGKYKSLGLYDSKEEAAKAYNIYALKHFKDFAWTNTLK